MATNPLERLRRLCLALPETTERLSHGEPTWFIRDKKTFVSYANHHHDDRLAFWCAAPPGSQQSMVASDPLRFFVPPYVGHRGWLGVYLDVPVDWPEIGEIVRRRLPDDCSQTISCGAGGAKLTKHIAPAVRVVGGVLRSNGKLFLCHRRPDRVSYPDVWDLPGGHVNEGESIHQALVRELGEELGIQILPPQGEPWVTLQSDDLELHVFLIDHWEGDPRNLAEDEHDDIRWVSDDELMHLELADPSYLSLLRQALIWKAGDQGSPSE